MATWQIKEMSEKTGVSERMLRHFEKIGLLVPVRRSDNRYRSYSEQDLTALQQIIALKTFGFSLNPTKDLCIKFITVSLGCTAT